MGPIEGAYVAITNRLDDFISNNFFNVADYAGSIVTGLVMILAAWAGYKLLAGRTGGDTANDLILLFVKYGAIIFLFDVYDNYEAFVVGWIQETPNSIAALFPYETDAAGVARPRENVSLFKIDNFLSRTVTVAVDMMSWTNVGESLLAILVIIIALLATVFAVLQFGIADIGTVLFLAVGPFAITAGLFPQSRGIFEGWLRILVTLIVLKVLVVLVLELMLGAFGTTAIELQDESLTNNGFESILAFLIFTGLIFMVLLKTPDLSSQLGGGLSLSAAALTSYAGYQAARFMGGSMKAGAKRAAGGAIGGYRGYRSVSKNTPEAEAGDKEGAAARRKAVWRGARAGAMAGAAPGMTYIADAHKRRARMVVAQLNRQDEIRRANAARLSPKTT